MISKILKQIRESKNIGVNELSRLSGINASYISAIERNEKQNPSIKTLNKLAKALDVPVNDFFDKDDLEKNIPVDYINKYGITTKDIKQYKEQMKHLNETFFMNDKIDDEDKKEILDSMNELFWEAKAKNKKKPKDR